MSKKITGRVSVPLFLSLRYRYHICKLIMPRIIKITLQLAERREDTRQSQASLESTHLVRHTAEYRHAIHGIGALVLLYEAVVNGESTAVAGKLCAFEHLRAVRAAWIGDEVYRLIQPPFESLARIL